MSSNTDVEFTSRKTNRRKSLQQKQQLDNIDIKAISINDDAKKRRKTINVVHKPINTSSDDAAINNSISYDNEMKKLNKITNIDLDEIKKLWKIGTLVEARDLHDNWYKSRIIEVDESNKRVKVHFFGWNSRYDQWFNLCSNDLRPIADATEKIEITAPIAQIQVASTQAAESAKFNVGEKILAKWIDDYHYPATVIRTVNKNNTLYYEVRFEDGVKKMIRFNNCKVYDPINDIVGVKPAEVVSTPVEQKPVIEENAQTSSTTAVVQEDNSNVRKSSRVKRPRTLSDDEIALFPIRRQSSGVNKKQKINEDANVSQVIENITLQTNPVEPQQQQQQQQPVVTTVSTPIVKPKKLPLGDYFKSLALYNANKKRNKTISVETQPSKEAPKIEPQPVVNKEDLKLQVNINNSENKPSIKLKISKLVTIASETNDLKMYHTQSHASLVEQSHTSLAQQLSVPSPITELIRCKFANCDKTFRKQHLLDYHIKYHHYEDGRIIEVVTKKRKLTQNDESNFDSSQTKECKRLKIDEKVKKKEEAEEKKEALEEEGDPYEVIQCKCDKNISVGFMIQVTHSYFTRAILNILNFLVRYMPLLAAWRLHWHYVR